jgi:hypothetical protein
MIVRKCEINKFNMMKAAGLSRKLAAQVNQ